ncbi:hypothetical protein COCC4DRAFT_66490 [Bipolaris maydis ATCC 48331]|uniref:Uncharacterized protein n=2 Tax=Cochliobolus heterostrophus TaxID=5016 RepID=M2TTV4_COCH5|nr:uncharacterized protein COCC4DRAFT_66490 [Bipolaris maydis ATCC 48331]EMD85201.1 hypothetical protein COCHEDRAFT_1119633 [Bipolaris maydis C5]ENH99341.1 hypothetical protein COCC4DRAFT_66490 [Bipolaris maydis ATCC 48331]KAJ5026963.1 hypothetical protein J3E73DRAFT_391082 [Bipolaris maydis]KAJ6271712.1 hypothetical protein PSV08DRAFT_178099 [Bipolaris maydis]
MPLALCSSALFFLVQNVTAIGGNKVNITDVVGFVQEDNERDTISLLISCFATLGLCVYSAVHLNVPHKGEGNYRVLSKELQWCVLGLFAPELILYTAWRQLASARQLCFEIENITMTETHMKDPKTPWTITHGLYASMGGFALDLDSTGRRSSTLFKDVTRLTLTAKGVLLLAKCGHIVEISLEEIKDKNKADGLAKLLVCIQAGWMIVQVISRTAVGLPTTLLEVHVVAHVVCALVMYILWWHKPRQVASPTILKGDLMPLIAYMYMASRMSGKQPQGKLAIFRSATPELAKLAYFEDENVTSYMCSNRESLNTTCLPTAGRLRPRPNIQIANQEAETASCNSPMEATSELQSLAEKAIKLYPVLKGQFHPVFETECSEPSYKIPEVTELVQPYAIDWPNDGLLRRTQSLVMGMVLWGASMAYGGIHVAAWNYFFSTRLEQLFWRMSSVWVTFCAAFWLVTNLLAHVFPLIDRIWNAYNQRTLSVLSTAFITTLCVLCGVSYIASRAYIVIEAFVSIREVPRGVYETPTWSQVFPHL